jgi:hypothetical protein
VKLDSGKVEKEVELGALDRKRPHTWEVQLSILTSFLASLYVTNVKEAVSVRNIRRPLVTGTTGFVGRHFIADLRDTLH